MVSLSAALKYDRRLIQSLPAGVYLFMLLLYLLTITGHVSHITELLILYEALGLAASAYLVLAKKKAIREPFADPGNLVFIILLILLYIVSLHMRITNFDDFHSWAITPKDMYYVNGLPTGSMASTFYRDYFPTVFIMDFLMFRLTGAFRESTMYFVLWALMLVSLAELTHRKKEDDSVTYICRALLGIMLPFLISFQFLHSVGTDILATTVFGSALVYIMDIRRGDEPGVFGDARIILTVTVLGMLKTTSLILSLVCIGVFFVRMIEPKKIKSWLVFSILPVITLVFWESWKIFCRIKGNTTYLSDNLEKNMSSGHTALPDYALSTAKEFTLKLFTYGLNDGAAGLSSAVILLIFVVSFIIYIRRNGRRSEDRLSLAVILLGMAGYLLVMLYVYLFVFEEWEALSLSSYDRYIATYFGAMLYAALYLLMKERLRPVWTAPLITLVLAVTVNFGYVERTLVPSGYQREYGELIAEIDSIEEEFLKAAGERPGYGECIVVVDPSEDQLRSKVLPYAAVPGVTRLIKPAEDGTMPDEGEIQDMADDYNARIIDLRR